MAFAQSPDGSTASAAPMRTLLAAANAVVIVGVAVTIELTGGFPSQLAHLYYIPVVVSALTLNRNVSLAVAILAAVLVTPAIDVFHELIGRPAFFADPRPWNVTPSGWILRPLAFLAISMVGTRLTQEHREKLSEHARSEARGEELSTLNRIDKMILSGAGEAQSIQEITRFVLDVTGAHFAGVVTPAPDGTRELNFQGHYRNQPDPWIEEHLPYEGVTGWAITHGRTSWTRDILADSRYQRLAEIARERGIRSTAAAAIVLDGAILGALVTGHDEVHDFTSEELATLERLADQAAVAVTNARQRETLQRMALDTAMVLSNVIESRDAYTGDHCIRLVDYVEVTAKALGLNGRDVDLVKLGAAMHDVGKIAVPDDVLKKPDKLTPDEYTLIKQHCYVGGQICKKVAFLEPVYPMVYYHHEHFDGRGYPDGIAGDKIPLGARIIAVADAFDAMTNDRPYRRSIGHDRAVDTLMTGAGTQWDPEIVRCFLKTISQTHTDAQIA